VRELNEEFFSGEDRIYMSQYLGLKYRYYHRYFNMRAALRQDFRHDIFAAL
jgi:hypothetical protein